MFDYHMEPLRHFIHLRMALAVLALLLCVPVLALLLCWMPPNPLLWLLLALLLWGWLLLWGLLGASAVVGAPTGGR